MALMLGLYGFYLSIGRDFVYPKKVSKEALIFPFKNRHSDKGGISAVFFGRMLIGKFLLK